MLKKLLTRPAITLRINTLLRSISATIFTYPIHPGAHLHEIDFVVLNVFTLSF